MVRRNNGLKSRAVCLWEFIGTQHAANLFSFAALAVAIWALAISYGANTRSSASAAITEISARQNDLNDCINQASCGNSDLQFKIAKYDELLQRALSENIDISDYYDPKIGDKNSYCSMLKIYNDGAPAQNHVESRLCAH